MVHWCYEMSATRWNGLESGTVHGDERKMRGMEGYAVTVR